MRFNNWDIGSFNRDTAVTFCRNGINPLVSVFLASRGINDISDVHALLGEVPAQIHDPFLNPYRSIISKSWNVLNKNHKDFVVIAVCKVYMAFRKASVGHCPVVCKIYLKLVVAGWYNVIFHARYGKLQARPPVAGPVAGSRVA